jgi:hypothetical protein
MRQVLLAASRANPWSNGRDGSWNPRPVLLWADDRTQIGDGFVWAGVRWVVSAVYGTRFCGAEAARRRERPHQRRDGGDGLAVPIDR